MSRLTVAAHEALDLKGACHNVRLRIIYVMTNWLACAASGPIVRRAATSALIVGPILIVINHSDAITSGHISGVRLLRIALTFIVPYLVSTVSSVLAVRARPQGVQRRIDVSLIAPIRTGGRDEV